MVRCLYLYFTLARSWRVNTFPPRSCIADQAARPNLKGLFVKCAYCDNDVDKMQPVEDGVVRGFCGLPCMHDCALSRQPGASGVRIEAECRAHIAELEQARARTAGPRFGSVKTAGQAVLHLVSLLLLRVVVSVAASNSPPPFFLHSCARTRTYLLAD